MLPRTSTNFFKDLIVLELASVLAGPAIGMFFAELGAKVIKVENKTTGGDVTRNWKLSTEKVGDLSAYYCSVNYQKEVLMLDLKVESDKTVLFEWIAKADVVISNYRLPSAAKMGVDYESCKALKPDIIYAQLTGFGETSTRPAFDVVLQAEAGFLYMSGEPDGAEVKMPVALIDLLAAHQLKEAILIAIIHQMRTGEGSYVTSSLLEAAVASLANQATNWLMNSKIPQKMGTQHPNIAPYGSVFNCADDKKIVLAIGTEKQFMMLCKSLNMNELVSDKRFHNNQERVAHSDALNALLAPAFLQKNRSTWMDIFLKENIPAGSIRDMEEVFQIRAVKDMILEELTAQGQITKRVKTVGFQIRR